MYLDSAILVKLLIPERDSKVFASAVKGKIVSSSELASTEIWATLLRKERDGEIGATQRAAAWTVFLERVRDKEINLHPLNSSALLHAHRVLEQCYPLVPLRSLDAIHCAACDLSQDFPLCTTDKRMRDAATILSIPVFPDAL